MKYVVVLPAKNEQDTIKSAVESVVKQTIPPMRVLIMDDASTDRTPQILAELESEYPSVRHHRVTSSSEYTLGGHVVRLFNEGKRVLDEEGLEYDWIVKMDADLQCESDFIERIAERIRGRKMGIVSGTPYFEENGKKIFDTSPSWHTHGQFKIYNAECFDEVGGPREHLGWDCADNVRAISAGWDCEAIRDINYLMHRKVGGKSSNKAGRMNHGFGCYITGFGIGYFALKVVHDLFKPPVIVGAFDLVRGYLRAAVGRHPKVLTPSQQKLIRRLLWASFWVRLRRRDFDLQQRLSGS